MTARITFLAFCLVQAAAIAACQRKTAPPAGSKPAPAAKNPAGAHLAINPPAAVRRPAAALLKPYPHSWKRDARADNRFICGRLVYKKGCEILRKGVVTLEIALSPKGKVRSLKPLSNTIKVDPGLVLKCIMKVVRGWRFKPPRGVSPRFPMKFILSDKC